MELRKDPITRSWVICGDEPEAGSSADLCVHFARNPDSRCK